MMIQTPMGTGLPALTTLVALAEAAGGSSVVEDGCWRLVLPRQASVVMPSQSVMTEGAQAPKV